MKNLMIATLFVSSSLILTPALAARTTIVTYEPYPPPYSAPQNIVYISGDIGLGRLATPDQVLFEPDGAFIDGAGYDTGYHLAAGGNVGFQHAVNRTLLLGVEAGYDYNGQSKYTESYNPSFMLTDSTTYRISSTDIHLLGTSTLLFHNGFNIFAKAGAARVDQKLRVTNQVDNVEPPILLGTTNLVGYKPMAAVGTGYQFRAVNIYGQYSHIFGSNPENFSDLFNTDGSFANIVSVDTFKIGAAVQIRI